VSPTQEIIDENYDDLILTVERKFKSFNWLIFFILLLLWILPWIIYAIATLQEKSIKTMIYFWEDWEVLRLSNQKSTYLMWKYNKHIGKENMKIVQKTQE
jgi:biopolymer transport protein ExbB/TolQ